jgi:hypothetical protein
VTANDGFEIQQDLSRNLIQISWRGHVGVAESNAAGERVALLLPQMRRGFTLLADLSGLDSMELDCAPGIARLMDTLRENGIGTVVRIVPDATKDIGLNILAIVHYRGTVQVITCHTAEEAGRVLNPPSASHS